MRKFLADVGFFALAVFAVSRPAMGSESSEWLRIGTVESSCSFAAELDLLDGYPFARLRIGDQVIALAVSESVRCRSVSYRQVPEPRAIPTYDVSLTSLCMSRLPVYTVTRSLGGVQEHCQIVE